MIKEVKLVSCCTSEAFDNEVNRWLAKGFRPRGNLIISGNNIPTQAITYSLLMVKTEGCVDRWEFGAKGLRK